jgi:hypothetical protein
MSGSDIHSVATLLGHNLAQHVNRLDSVYDLVERPQDVPAESGPAEPTAVNR